MECLTDPELQAFLDADMPDGEQVRHIEGCDDCIRRAERLVLPAVDVQIAAAEAAAHAAWDGTGCPPQILLLHPECSTDDLERRAQLQKHIASCAMCPDTIRATHRARDYVMARSNVTRRQRD